VGLLDDFSLIADPDNLYKAFKKSKKGVSWKESVQRYEMNLLRNISETRRKLLAGESVSHGFVEFDLMERGRFRHIKSVHISERVVQKCMCDQVLVPCISRSLFYDNGASLKNKGLHFSIRRLITHLSKYYRQQGSNEGYCLMVDFSKFFDNIRHEDLFAMQDKLFKDKRIMALIRGFIEPFGDGKSLGLGSQVSQISAIYYPNRPDHFLKEVKRVKFYGRYMDDMYLIHQDKAFLQECLREIVRICANLGITVNTRKTRIAKLKNGIKFLKGTYSMTNTGKVLRKGDPDSRKRMHRKLANFFLKCESRRA
jgi:retron-type reverse transcriptase